MDMYDSVYHGEKMKHPAPEVDAQSIDVSRLWTATGIAGDIGLTGRVTAVVCRGFHCPPQSNPMLLECQTYVQICRIKEQQTHRRQL